MKQYRKCGGGGGDGSGGNGGNGGNGNGSSTDSDQKLQGQNSLSLDLTPGIDPSGFVCEAVPSNVLEGVTVTLYSSDGNQKWNAEEYDQENPLITNTDGVYAWDVPAGKWQVKFAKGEKALKLFDTQAEAITFAKEKAKNQDGNITIHKTDGKIRKQNYSKRD